MKSTLSSGWPLLLSIALYMIGLFLCPSEDFQDLKDKGYAEQQEYSWTDSDGEEHEDETLVYVKNIGYVLSYRVVYGSPIGLFIPFLILGRILFGDNHDELTGIIFGNCVVGFALIALSTRVHVASTIFYWAGIIAASYINYHFKKE